MNCTSCNRNMSPQLQHRYSQMQRSQYSNNRMNREQNNYNDSTSCRCSNENIPDMEPVDRMEVSMGYVPWQTWGEIYDDDVALKKGTIFVDLDKPWIGRCYKNE